MGNQIERPKNERYPALTAWRRELSCGERTAAESDWLWRAACEEIAAAEMERDGLPEVAETCRDREKAFLRSVVKRDGAAA